MPSLRALFRRSFFTLIHLVCVTALLAGCQGETVPSTTTVAPVNNDRPKAVLPQAEILFQVQTPSVLGEDQKLYMELLDEVTGLALNASRVEMQPQEGGQQFTAEVSFPIGSILKYRYVRSDERTSIEYNSLAQQVRYRLFYVEGDGTVTDVISAWKSEPAADGLGRIQGTVATKTSNVPIVNALVTAGGMHTFSASDGSFLLEGLPPGTHNLVVYSLDGAFRPFQQGAVVAPNSTTPAQIVVNPNQTVNVTFLVTPPEDNLTGVPVRMVGNIYSLGNTFADLSGGVSILASRAPFLSIQPDGRYSLTLRLPVGFDLRYKYTLGDGFWNAERAANGGIRLRQMIVPNQDTTIEEEIDTWKTNGLEPVSFTVTVPENTPASNTISIQFNPYGWTEPIPMWPLGSNRWFYILYNPLNLFQNASYRYCRNEQCGVADTVETRGIGATGKPFSPSSSAQEIQDTVSAWAWLDPVTEPVIVSAGEINARDGFMAGVEFMPVYHPSWQPYLGAAFQNVKDLGGNSVILSPTWRLTHQSPPVMEPVTGKDPLWFDMINMAGQAQQKQLTILIHPQLSFNQDPDEWWQTAARGEGWWQSWFDRYRTFLIYHADLAAQTGAQALVIGDENLLPALPGGALSDGSPSGVPEDSEERWKAMITEVRKHYSGKLIWMIPYAGELPLLPSFLNDLDGAYIQLSPPFFEQDQTNQADLANALGAAFDEDLAELQGQNNRPVYLGLKQPSVTGALDGCVTSNDECLPSRTFDRPGIEAPTASLGLKEQADAYSAVLSALNQRPWINGFFAAGYYPPADARDLSVSIHGKPASDVLWYWFPRLLGSTTP